MAAFVALTAAMKSYGGAALHQYANRFRSCCSVPRADSKLGSAISNSSALTGVRCLQVPLHDGAADPGLLPLLGASLQPRILHPQRVPYWQLVGASLSMNS